MYIRSTPYILTLHVGLIDRQRYMAESCVPMGARALYDLGVGHVGVQTNIARHALCYKAAVNNNSV